MHRRHHRRANRNLAGRRARGSAPRSRHAMARDRSRSRAPTIARRAATAEARAKAVPESANSMSSALAFNAKALLLISETTTSDCNACDLPVSEHHIEISISFEGIKYIDAIDIIC